MNKSSTKMSARRRDMIIRFIKIMLGSMNFEEEINANLRIKSKIREM
jgi:hypothetical protein